MMDSKEEPYEKVLTKLKIGYKIRVTKTNNNSEIKRRKKDE